MVGSYEYDNGCVQRGNWWQARALSYVMGKKDKGT
jgi:hypothetical protein